MQFREVGNRVQCLVAVYDPEAKRTRQKMVHSLILHGKNEVPAAADLGFGSDEDRALWVSNIEAYIKEKEQAREARRVAFLPRSIEIDVNMIIADYDSQSRKLTDADYASILSNAQRLIAALSPKTARAPRKAGSGLAGRAGFGDEVKARARELRKTETVARTTEILNQEGYSVSKSWVQKWSADE